MDQPSPESASFSGQRIALALASLLLVYAAISLVVPFLPAMPSPGLDQSWMAGMNEAMARGMDFGRDIVFTFGPYASIYTASYHPATDAPMLWGSLYLGIMLAVVLLRLLAGTSWLPRLGVALLLVEASQSRDALLLLYPLAAAVCTCRSLNATAGPPGQRRSALFLVLLFAPFGLLSLVKGTMLILCIGMATLSMALLAHERRMLAAGAVAGASIGSLLLFWIAAGQPVAALPHYLVGVAQVSAGYTEAMAVRGASSDVVLALAGSALLCGLAAACEAVPSRRHRVFMLLAYAAAAFVAFKAGFVRHDSSHDLIAPAFLVLAAALLATSRGAVGLLLTLPFLASWLMLTAPPQPGRVPPLVDKLDAMFGSSWLGLSMRLDGTMERDFHDQMARIRARVGFPRLAGTTDIYSHDQLALIASGNTWNPRPVLQSYSAYTPALARLNRDHLLSRKAPDNVIFRVEPIDGRLPALEDGPSWPVLLQGYAPTGLLNDAVLLRRRASPPPAPTEHRRSTHRHGDWIPVPAGGPITYARIHVPLSRWEALQSTAFKPGELQVRLRLKDGTERRFRLVRGMAAAGLVLSPLVETSAEFGLLYADPKYLAHKRVEAFAVSAVDPGEQSSGPIDVEFSAVPSSGAPAVEPQLLGFRSLAGTPASAFATKDACDGKIDRLDGQAASNPHRSSRPLLSVYGWLADTSAGTARDPRDVVLVLQDRTGAMLLAPLQSAERLDVHLRYRSDAYRNSGFLGTVDVSGLRGEYQMRFGFRANGRIQLCPAPGLAGTYVRTAPEPAPSPSKSSSAGGAPAPLAPGERTV